MDALDNKTSVQPDLNDLQAQYDARPRSIYDKGGMINDTLRAMGRVR